MSNSDLFRDEAMKAQQNKLDGEVIIAQPVSATILTLSLILAFILIIIFLSTSSLNRKETVQGFLEPKSGITRVTSIRDGVVKAIYVTDGEDVQKGQPLILINIPENLSSGESLNAQIAVNLAEQTSILKERKAQLWIQAEFQEKELTQLIDFHLAQSKDLQEQYDLVNQRLVINESRLNNLESLGERGVLALEDVQQQHETLLSVRQQLAELRGTMLSHRAQIEQLTSALERLPSDTSQQVNLVNTEISRLQHEQLELSARGEIMITAPVSGVVTNSMVEVGHHVQQNRSLITLVPNDIELKAVLLVPTRAYGFVQSGQVTRIRFDAFPYQRFGLFEGQISKTSRSIVLPNEIEMPVAIQEPVYRVEATLNTQGILAYGDSMPLQAGMLLNADVILEERSLLAWLLEPLYSLKGRL